MRGGSEPRAGGVARRDILLVVDVQGQPAVSVRHADGRAVQPDDPAFQAFARNAQAGWARMLGAVSRLVSAAVAHSTAVVFLEDAKVNHPTHPALWHALGPAGALVVRKFLDDGSQPALAALAALGVEPGEVLVCGALTRVCVRETVLGLRRALGRDRVRVAPGACFDEEWDEAAMGGAAALVPAAP